MNIHHLNCTSFCPNAGPWIGVRELVCHCLLIETDEGLVLVDTGLGLEDVERPHLRLGRSFAATSGATRERHLAAASQVEALGFSRSDVRHICLTHLDLDHAGGLSDFPEARVHLLAEEHRAATGPLDARLKLRYRPAQWAHGPRWQTYDAAGERWFGFPRVKQLVGLPPEILMVALAGHSPGHCGIAVQTGDRWLLHAGDAYYHRQEIHPSRPGCPRALRAMHRAVEYDRAARVETMRRLRELSMVQDHVRVFSAHDPVELAQLQAQRLTPGG